MENGKERGRVKRERETGYMWRGGERERALTHTHICTYAHTKRFSKKRSIYIYLSIFFKYIYIGVFIYPFIQNIYIYIYISFV